MQCDFIHSTVLGAGPHDVLSVIPTFLDLYDLRFGKDIEDLDVEIRFRSDDSAADLKTQPEVFEKAYLEFLLPLTPEYEIKPRAKRLQIYYLSDEKPFPDMDRNFGRCLLKQDSSHGCNQLEKLLLEFLRVLGEVGPLVEKENYDFDWRQLTSVIENRLKKLPKRDGDIIAMMPRIRHVDTL